MNTKQVEELTGISRQNIRYYERQGLLEPAREDGNAYRDYSEEDIRRLKLIKMLRMLDMPLKEIEKVLKDESLLKEAVARQQETLQKQQKQLQAAIEVCASIHKEHTENVDVDGYLQRMENMSQNGGVFAKIVDDYKQVALDEEQRKITFYTEQAVNTSGEFEFVLRKYAAEHQMKFKQVKSGMYPEFALNGITYAAVRIQEDIGTRIVCKRESKGLEKKEISIRRRKMFQGIHSVTANIRRHRWKSILNVLVSMLTVVVMLFYMGNLSSIRQQLAELPEKIPVTGQVWNVCGKADSGVFIPQKMVDAVYESEHTAGIAESSELIGHLQEGAEYQLWGISSMTCIDGSSVKDITWADDWDWDRFQKSTGVCLVDSKILENNDLQMNQKIDFSLERYQPDLSGILLTRQSLLPTVTEIVGTVDFKKLSTTEVVPDVILPLKNVKQIYEENRMVYSASSLSFRVKDPMKLNALKQELKDAGFQNVEKGSKESYTGAGLKIEDTIFIQTMTSLEKSRSLIEGFRPFVLLVVVMIGYIIPHLLLQGRREEYAIMRALGTSRKRCSVLFFTEHIFLAITGSVAGVIIGSIFQVANLQSAMAVWSVFLGCYALGAAAALWMFGRFSVAAVLSHRD